MQLFFLSPLAPPEAFGSHIYLHSQGFFFPTDGWMRGLSTSSEHNNIHPISSLLRRISLKTEVMSFSDHHH